MIEAKKTMTGVQIKMTAIEAIMLKSVMHDFVVNSQVHVSMSRSDKHGILSLMYFLTLKDIYLKKIDRMQMIDARQVIRLNMRVQEAIALYCYGINFDIASPEHNIAVAIHKQLS